MKTGKKEEAAAYLQKCMATEDEGLKQACAFGVLDPSAKEQYEKLPPNTRLLVDAQVRKTAATASTTGAGMSGLLSGLASAMKSAAD